MSASASVSTAPDYVIIEVAALGNRRRQPFKNVLKEPKTKRGQKTRRSTFLYLFKTKHEGTVYTKLGNSSDVKTYGSKDRYCPMLDYEGWLQVLQFGAMLERLMKAYLRSNYKQSEWYVNCEAKLEAFLAALRANAHFQTERPYDILNVAPFPRAFTARHGGAENEYLSLFRVRDTDGRLYRLTRANIELSVAAMLKPEFIDEAPEWRLVTVKPVADAAPPAAPAVVLVQ